MRKALLENGLMLAMAGLFRVALAGLALLWFAVPVRRNVREGGAPLGAPPDGIARPEETVDR
jgi:hypothetical protein